MKGPFRQSPSQPNSLDKTATLRPNYQDIYSIDIKLSRSNATYKPDETVTGQISLASKNHSAFKVDVNSIILEVDGSLTIKNNPNRPQVGNIRIKLSDISFIRLRDIVLARDRTIIPDVKVPFRFKLEKGEHKYLETYIGVYINITYTITALVRFTDGCVLKEEIPFYIQVPGAGRDAIDSFVYPKKKNFMVLSEDIKGDQSKIPRFKIRGELQTQICYFNDNLWGSIIIDLADSPIRSIDLQMLRVESAKSQSQSFSERTQIQMIQICDGNVSRNLELPLFMILPRYFSCPSVKYAWCQINFEINLLIIFKDGFKVTVNIPLKLIRS